MHKVCSVCARTSSIGIDYFFLFELDTDLTIAPRFLPKFIVETDSTRLDLSGLTLTKNATLESPEISSWRHSVLCHHKPTRCVVQQEATRPTCGAVTAWRSKAHEAQPTASWMRQQARHGIITHSFEFL